MSYWSAYIPSASSPWNLGRVVHLHRRAGFAATWPELQRDLADGPEKAVTRLLNGASRIDGVPADFETLSATISRAAVDAGDTSRLKAWWVFRGLFGPDPLGERLTLMWHNHFATSMLKVANLNWMFQQNQVFRRHARAEFRTLLTAMLDDPALLNWLDATANRSGHPNENLAREVMELFTLGIGNYTEHDIQEAARALTGITIQDNVVKFDLSKHDSGSKTIFGQTGQFEPKDLADLLISQPAAAQRLAWRLCHEFCGEGAVSSEAMQQLASGLRANQLRIDWAIETILRSEVFFSSANLRNRVADPACFLLGAMRALECDRSPPSTLAVADALRRMGLDLYFPPNVGGWTGGRAWLSTRTVIARTSAISDFVYGRMHLPAAPLDLDALITRHRVGESLPDCIRFFGDLLWGEIDESLVDELTQAVRDVPDRSSQLRQAVVMLLTQPRAHCH